MSRYELWIKAPRHESILISITDIDKVLTMVSVPGVTRGAVLVSGLRPALLPASQCPLPDLRVPFTPLIMSTLSNQKHAGYGATTERGLNTENTHIYRAGTQGLISITGPSLIPCPDPKASR